MGSATVPVAVGNVPLRTTYTPSVRRDAGRRARDARAPHFTRELEKLHPDNPDKQHRDATLDCYCTLSADSGDCRETFSTDKTFYRREPRKQRLETAFTASFPLFASVGLSLFGARPRPRFSAAHRPSSLHYDATRAWLLASGIDGDHKRQEIYAKGKTEGTPANQFEREVA
jgi:hypothetical protein